MADVDTTTPVPPEGVEGFDLDAVYRQKRKDPFWFQWEGRWWSLPHLQDVDWRLSKLADADGFNLDSIDGMFQKAFDREQREAWQAAEQPLTILPDLWQRWMAHSGQQPGESQASTGSSKSTGRPSKRTSAGSTKSGSRTRSTAARKAATPPASSSG